MSTIIVKHKIGSVFLIGLLLLLTLSFVFISTSIIPKTEAASIWFEDTTSDFNQGTFEDTALDGSGSDAEVRLDYLITPRWEEKFISTKPPGREGYGNTGIYGTDNVLLFGGYNGGNLGDTWVYDRSANTWSKKALATAPGIRLSHTISTIWGYDQALLYAGYNSGYLSDTWIYDLSANTWTQKTPTGSPGERYGHAMAPIHNDDKVVLFSGYRTGWKTDTWVYDLSANTWTKKSPVANPDARELSRMNMIWGTDKVVLFGGRNPSALGDTWVYDLSDNNWTRMYPENPPLARSKHGMTNLRGTDKVMIFGGTPGLADTWIYDYSDNAWTEVLTTTKPSNRNVPCLAGIPNQDSAILFSGARFGYPDDTWEFQYPKYKSTGTFTSAPMDLGSRSYFKDINWTAKIPDNTEIRFQLRTADSKSGLASMDFVGEDGNSSLYYNTTNRTIWDGHNGGQWVQYKAYLTTSSSFDTPFLRNVTINYNRWSETKLVNPVNGIKLNTNKPTFAWTYEDQDSEDQLGFQVLIDDNSNFNTIDYDSGEQSSSQQFWQFPEGTAYSVLPEGTWYWKVRTMDGDGDWGDYSNTFELIIDTKAPYSGVNLPFHNECYQSLSLITGTASDPVVGTGLDKIEIAINRQNDNYYWDGSDWIGSQVWLLASGNPDWEYNCSSVTWSTGNRYIIQSRACDLASNMEVSSSGIIFIFDTEAPKSMIKSPVNGSWLKSVETISGESEDTGGAGINYVELSIEHVTDNTFWSGINWSSVETWLPVTGTTEWILDTTTIAFTSGSEYKIVSRSMDNGGIAEPSSSLMQTTFSVDSEAPTTSISIDGGQEFTSSAMTTLSLVATDTNSGIFEMTLSNDNIEWSPWMPFTTTKSNILPSGDGEKHVYFKVSDKAGNIAGMVSDSIILDTTPPEQMSILINEDAEFTNSTTVALALTAQDLTSGVKNMSFSFDGVYWDAWDEFNKSKAMDLITGDGEKTVYFRVKDMVDNIAHTTDSIVL
jgi:hypothetical protein